MDHNTGTGVSVSACVADLRNANAHNTVNLGHENNIRDWNRMIEKKRDAIRALKIEIEGLGDRIDKSSRFLSDNPEIDIVPIRANIDRAKEYELKVLADAACDVIVEDDKSIRSDGGDDE